MKKYFLFVILVLFLTLSLISASEEKDKSFGIIEFKINDIPDIEVRGGISKVLSVELYRLNESLERIEDSQILLEFEDQNIEVEAGLYELKVFTEDKIFTRQINVTKSKDEPVMRAMYTNTQQKDIEADIPWGVVPKKNFPLLLMVHDADLNDYDVYDIKTYDDNLLLQDDSDDILVDILDLDGDSCWLADDFETIDEKLWYRIRELNVSDFNIDTDGFINIRVFFDQAGLCDALDWDTEVFRRIKVLDTATPKFDNWYCGDTHYHSSYTDTWWGITEFLGYGEIGGPIEMAVDSLDSIGLDWVTVTDHSNSFGDNEGFWDDFYDECGNYDECLIEEEVNSDPEVLGNIPTCESLPGNHILAYRIEEGYTDGACNGVENISERLTKINNDGGFAYIAHPESQDDAIFGWDSIITNFRGYSLDNYQGLQIWNQDIRTRNDSLEALEEGLEKWKDVLLGRNGMNPRKVFISAGSDAHGDFQEFGKEYTCVYASSYSKSNIFTGLENGNSYISNNGALIFNINGEKIGGTKTVTEGTELTLEIDYDLINDCTLRIYKGIIDSSETQLGSSISLSSGSPGNKIRLDTPNQGTYYYRLECISSTDRIYTNPIWVEVNECVPNWSCTDWQPEECSINEIQTRTCTDSNECETDEGKPPEQQSCIYIPNPSIELIINSPINGKIYSDRRILLDIETTEEVDEIGYTYLDSRGRERYRRLCRNCDEYNRKRSFSAGWNNLTFKALNNGIVEDEENISFFIDYKDPRISKTEPRRGFSDGNFYVEFREDNPENLTLYYGNSIRTHELDIENDCSENRGKHKCSVWINLSDFDNKEIKYWFEILDIAGNFDDSRKRDVDVDMTDPVLNNPDSFWERGTGRYSKYLYFDISITEKNFDEVVLSYDYRGRTKEKILCSRLRYGKCEKRFTMRDGYTNLKLIIRDEAGNEIEEDVLVSISAQEF